MRAILYIFIILTALNAQGQFIENDTIRFGGMVFDENKQAMPNAHILINSKRGTLTSSTGFFDMKVNARDTITVSYVGYKRLNYIIPDSMSRVGYVTGIFLKRDTLSLSEIIVLPWLNKNQFKQAFVEQKQMGKNDAHARANLSLLSANPGNQYDYMKQSGIDVQMAQFNNAQEYKGLVGPDNMVGMNIGAAIGLLIKVATWKNEQEKQEIQIKNRLLRHKLILEQMNSN